MSFLERHSWLGHIIEAIIQTLLFTAILSIFTDPLSASAIGSLIAAGMAYSREKRDAENFNHSKPPQLKEYWPGYWPSKSKADAFPTMGLCMLYSGLISTGAISWH
jgi:hypothetical protein